MPHPKHYLEVSQTMLFKEFRDSHPRLHVSQRDSESLKPFYYVPLKIENTKNIFYNNDIYFYFFIDMNLQFGKKRSHLLHL